MIGLTESITSGDTSNNQSCCACGHRVSLPDSEAVAQQLSEVQKYLPCREMWCFPLLWMWLGWLSQPTLVPYRSSGVLVLALILCGIRGSCSHTLSPKAWMQKLRATVHDPLLKTK